MLAEIMANQNQSFVVPPEKSREDANSWVWPIRWLLSFICPFLLLFILSYSFRNRNVDGVTALVLILGPFVCGIVGSLWSFRGAKLSVLQSLLLLLATIVVYGIGFVVFLIVCTMAFGVVAT